MIAGTTTPKKVSNPTTIQNQSPWTRPRAPRGKFFFCCYPAMPFLRNRRDSFPFPLRLPETPELSSPARMDAFVRGLRFNLPRQPPSSNSTLELNSSSLNQHPVSGFPDLTRGSRERDLRGRRLVEKIARLLPPIEPQIRRLRLLVQAVTYLLRSFPACTYQAGAILYRKRPSPDKHAGRCRVWP